jgi:hypothetical protein
MLRQIIKRIWKESLNIVKSEYQLFKLRRNLKQRAVYTR